MHRSTILSMIWGATWGILSNRFGIGFSELAFWLPMIVGSLFITFTIRD